MTRVAGKTVLALVLAGGRGSRLAPLTDLRAKPAVPFLGTYRLIDFPLSNLVNSRLQDVWVIEQYMPHGLNDHLAGGRPWDLDRTRGGLVVMPPFADARHEDGEFAHGNAHALYQHAHLIRESGADLVLVLSADHVYQFDYASAIRAHLDKQASVTMVTTEVARPHEARRFGNVISSKTGKVEQFAYKPDQPLGRTVTAEIFVYDTRILLSTLEDLNRSFWLGDYGEQLLPALVARGDAYAYPLPGYWMDVGTLDAYLQAHRDFLLGRAFSLDDAQWPVLTSSLLRPPARLGKNARFAAALVCGGAEVDGQVIRSVIGPGARVERGAEVRDSVIQPGAVIGREARVSRAVVDQDAVIGQGARIGGQAANSRPTVIGLGATVGQGAVLGPGLVVAPRVRVKAGQEERHARPLETDDQG